MAFSDGQTAAMMVAAQASQGPTADLSTRWYTMKHGIRYHTTNMVALSLVLILVGETNGWSMQPIFQSEPVLLHVFFCKLTP